MNVYQSFMRCESIKKVEVEVFKSVSVFMVRVDEDRSDLFWSNSSSSSSSWLSSSRWCYSLVGPPEVL